MSRDIDFNKIKISDNTLFSKILEVEEITKGIIELVIGVKVIKIERIIRE